MTPNHTPQEVAQMQAEAHEALAQSEKAEGLEKLRLINKAFPFAIQGHPHGLHIAYDNGGWSVSDIGGFITVVDKEDTNTLFVMIGMETARRGSVRELITGEKKTAPPTPCREALKGKKITLADIGLKS